MVIMKMERKKIKIETKSGMTTIDVSECVAFTVAKTPTSMLKKAMYSIDIHMRSGTIFTSEIDEQTLILFSGIWEGDLK